MDIFIFELHKAVASHVQSLPQPAVVTAPQIRRHSEPPPHRRPLVGQVGLKDLA